MRNYMAQVKFTSSISTHLLFEAGYVVMPVDYNLYFQSNAPANAIATFDQTRSIMSGISPRQDFDTGTMKTASSSLTYVSGAHNLKAGLGYTAFLTTRSDIGHYTPIPGILPIASLEYGKVSLDATYVPGGKGFGNILFFWGKFHF